MYAAMAKYYAKMARDKFWYSVHRWTYTAGENPRKVVIVGGSYGGYSVAKRLANSLPSGYAVTLIEKHKHHNHTFVFPRYSVFDGNETSAFVPLENRDYSAIVPPGSMEVTFQECVDIGTDAETGQRHAILSNGQQVPFDYLVIATGARKFFPADLDNETAKEGVEKLKNVQSSIKNAKNIAIVGAGAVGVELATDIKYKYGDEKNVTLYNSRSRLLPRFHESVHEAAEPVCKELGVKLHYNVRPKVSGNTVTLPDGTVEEFDLVFPCVGGSASSQPFQKALAESINPKSGGIIVKPTLQLENDPKIFALGDVTDLDVPKMARACLLQSEVVTNNILSLIGGQDAAAKYVPTYVDGALHLTLGLNKSVLHLGADSSKLQEHEEDHSMHPQKTWEFFDSQFDPAKNNA